eukprot:1943164-Amphidinium_carterae.1
MTVHSNPQSCLDPYLFAWQTSWAVRAKALLMLEILDAKGEKTSVVNLSALDENFNNKFSALAA